uniref:Uncharacterized protein n=2 Tax=Oryza TaxID=4527 RepID=A0A0E0G7E0_ORYNI
MVSPSSAGTTVRLALVLVLGAWWYLGALKVSTACHPMQILRPERGWKVCQMNRSPIWLLLVISGLSICIGFVQRWVFWICSLTSP